MCGIAGIFTTSGQCSGELERDVTRMRDQLIARGPDHGGAWVDAEAGIAMGHRRLSVVDLTAAGHQPMQSASARYVLTFNGEIYNHRDLRVDLEKAHGISGSWKGSSDTETLLAGFEAWGIAATIRRAQGMFAFAVWDRRRHELTLARDRVGEKPLYYGWQGKGKSRAFLFGSDLNALRAHPAFRREIDRDSLTSYLGHNCVGGTRSIFRDVHKLAPGQLLTVSSSKTEPSIETYWSAIEAVLRGRANPFTGSAEDAEHQLESMLISAIGRQMVADVPTGAFLSGGIDSSLVVALMQEQSARKIRTFSIGFHEAAYDEASFARQVAHRLGTDHIELYVSPSEAMAAIPSLPACYSEPFADSSQIPTLLVSRLARKSVTVALSGDAGDELFCGYNRYRFAARVWNWMQYVPHAIRQRFAKAIGLISPTTWDGLGRLASHRQFGDKLSKVAAAMTSRSADELYRATVSQWAAPNTVVIGGDELAARRPHPLEALDQLGIVDRMMALDLVNYLVDDILTKVDRAAMSVSLETRVPLLDHNIVEFAWSLPLEFKLRDGVTKWPLRQILRRRLPNTLIDRPKMGFGVPIADWLRGPLRGWAEEYLSEARLRREGYFVPAVVRQKWTEHLAGRHNWQNQLWGVLMFQTWRESLEAA